MVERSRVGYRLYSWGFQIESRIKTNILFQVSKFSLSCLQHVSMYHRNKVHTDEFWKYELSKGSHRGGNRLGSSGFDSRQNDELWQMQINGGGGGGISSAKSSIMGTSNKGKYTNSKANLFPLVTSTVSERGYLLIFPFLFCCTF